MGNPDNSRSLIAGWVPMGKAIRNGAQETSEWAILIAPAVGIQPVISGLDTS